MYIYIKIYIYIYQLYQRRSAQPRIEAADIPRLSLPHRYSHFVPQSAGHEPVAHRADL